MMNDLITDRRALVQNETHVVRARRPWRPEGMTAETDADLFSDERGRELPRHELPSKWSERAGRVFGGEFDSVQVVAANPMERGHLGQTAGECIAISSDLLHSDDDALIAQVVGHELAHVVQQRQGRVLSSWNELEIPFNEAVDLESEADRWSAAFVEGSVVDAGAHEEQVSSLPVRQNLLLVGDQVICKQEQLPESISDVLCLIGAAEVWVAWASEDEYEFCFPNFESFVQELQLGLHASPFLSLRELDTLISPVTLCGYPRCDVADILRAEHGNGDDENHAKRVIARHEILTNRDLNRVREQMKKLGMHRSGILIGATLGDMIRLHGSLHLARRVADRDVFEQAAEWAAGMTGSANEFGDLLVFACHLLADGSHRTGAVNGHLTAVWTELNLILQEYLRCPGIPPWTPVEEVKEALNLWIRSGARLGFRTAAAGMRISIPHLDRRGREASSREEIDRIVGRAEAIVLGEELCVSGRSQDGENLALTASGREGRVTLGINGRGCLTITGLEFPKKKEDG